MIDVFSRYVIGGQVSTSPRADLALDALDVAMRNRRRTGVDLAGVLRSPVMAELISHQGSWRIVNDAEIATAEDVDWFTHRRLHGEIGLIPLVELCAAHAAERQPPSRATTVSAPAAASRLSLYETLCSTHRRQVLGVKHRQGDDGRPR